MGPQAIEPALQSCVTPSGRLFAGILRRSTNLAADAGAFHDTQVSFVASWCNGVQPVTGRA